MSAFDVRDLLKAASDPVAPGHAEAPSREDPRVEAEARSAHAGPISTVVLAGCVRAGECVVIALLGLALHQILLRGVMPLGIPHLAVILGVPAIVVTLFQLAGTYRLALLRDGLRAGLRLAACWTLAFLLVAGAMAMAKVADHATRLWLAGFYGAGFVVLGVGRALVARFIARRTAEGRFDRLTAIVGGGPAAEELIASLEAQPDSGIRIVGVFDDRGDDRASDMVAGYPKLGNVSDLVAYARHSRLDLIVFTVPISAEGRILQMLAKLWVLPIDIRLSAHSAKLRLRPRAYSYLGSVPVLDVFDKPIADWDIVAKTLFDRLVGLAALVALLPVMLCVGLAVRLTSPGPVFFRQKRHGFNNESIEVLKFRSMYADKTDPTAMKQVTRDDPRVTPVGRFIRKTSLDELPQLFNVVKGDLSLVGPRPHAIQSRTAHTLYDQVVDGYFARHRVKPGITGWAQINGWRGETDTNEKMQRRVEHDLYYIENWSVLFDLKILLATPFALFKTQNAY